MSNRPEATGNSQVSPDSAQRRLIDRLERQPFFESRCAQPARVAQYSQARQVSGEYGL